MFKRIGLWLRNRPYVSIALLVALMTIGLRPFGLDFDLVNVALIYLFPVLLSSVLWGIRPAFFAAFLGVLAFDFFFVLPIGSFTVADLRYLISFGVYLSVAALTASLAAKLKQQLLYAKMREAQTAALFELSKQISAITDVQTLLCNISKQASATVGREVAVSLTEEKKSATSGQGIAAEDWIPLQTEDRLYGVMEIRRTDAKIGLTTEQRRMLEAIAGLAASAIARVKLAEEAKIAHLSAESERLRTAILDSVSHELRTPLAAIIGSVTGLIDNDHLFTHEDRTELLTTIRDGALRMNRLVMNLLSMVQLESGMLRLRKNWCDVEDLIGVTLSQVRDFQQQRKLRLRLPESVPMVLGDEVLLEQMLVNVVSNAIKYSPDGSEILLSVRCEDEQLVLSVSDQGIGLDEGEYSRIFEKFYRSKSARRVAGTGLGLAICRGIAELHGGTISAKPNLPQGTVITMTLPLIGPNLPPSISPEKGTIAQ